MEDARRVVNPACSCHGEPMLWHKNVRRSGGGYWHCRVKEQERFRAMWGKRRGRDLAQKRDRYDTDPVHRIGKNLHDSARTRAARVRRKRQLLEEG